MPGEITRYRIDVPEADLADLRERLQCTRWPEAETVNDWSQGVPLAYLQDLCGYWADGYDWRATEARLNALPQFRTEIDGLSIQALWTAGALSPSQLGSRSTIHKDQPSAPGR
ncbi:MAG TPA: epoxide hydrolase N-terminal domain-containing protein [Streptosporangiaceae bacterium]